MFICPPDRTSLLVATLTDPACAPRPVFAAVSTGYHSSQSDVVLEAVLAQSADFYWLVCMPKLRAVHTKFVLAGDRLHLLLETGIAQTIFAF